MSWSCHLYSRAANDWRRSTGIAVFFLPCVFSDTITREVDVMGSPFLSLEESKAEWAKTAVRAAGRYKESGKARRSFGKELAEHGFDIRVEAGRLEEMYEEMK